MPSNSRAWFLGMIRSLLKIEPFRSLIVAFEDKLKTCSYFLYRILTLTSDLRISTRNKYNQFIFLVFFKPIGSHTRSQRYLQIWWLTVGWRVGFDLDWICCRLGLYFRKINFDSSIIKSFFELVFLFYILYFVLRLKILQVENH